MGKIIALIGASCVGKSEIAKHLGIKLGMEVRHCGEIVKQRADELSANPAFLSTREHRAIDNETRTLALSAETALVVEGTFLDHVLHGIENVQMVCLVCNKPERERRHAKRSSGASDAHQLRLRDEADTTLRETLYGNAPRFGNVIRIDSTDHAIPEVVQMVIAALNIGVD